MVGVNGIRLPREAIRPEGHWDWPSPVNFQQGVKVGHMVFVGGQVSAEGKAKILHAKDLEKQTEISMHNIRTVLECYGAKMDNIVKIALRLIKRCTEFGRVRQM